MADEQLANYVAQTTLTASYTAGAGSITVSSTGGSFPAAPSFSVHLVNATTFETICILRVTAITDGTHFAVTAEGTDTSAANGSIVAWCWSKLSQQNWNATRNKVGVYASLPSSGMLQGDRYKCTDTPVEFIYNSSAWVPFVDGYKCTFPNLASWGWQSTQGGATLNQTYGIIRVDLPATTTGEDQRMFVRTCGSTDDIRIFINRDPQWQNSQHYGLCVYNSANSKMLTFAVYPDGNVAYFRRDSPTGSNTAQSVKLFQNNGGKHFLRINKTSTDVLFYVSTNGRNWTLLATEAISTHIGAVTHIGLSGTAQNTSGYPYGADIYSLE